MNKIFISRRMAITQAKKLAETEGFIQVIRAGDKWYIETKPTMIRVFEEVIYEKIKEGWLE